MSMSISLWYRGWSVGRKIICCICTYHTNLGKASEGCRGGEESGRDEGRA